jgi:hypothetical protein
MPDEVTVSLQADAAEALVAKRETPEEKLNGIGPPHPRRGRSASASGALHGYQADLPVHNVDAAERHWRQLLARFKDSL